MNDSLLKNDDQRPISTGPTSIEKVHKKSQGNGPATVIPEMSFDVNDVFGNEENEENSDVFHKKAQGNGPPTVFPASKVSGDQKGSNVQHMDKENRTTNEA
jgi:hypothetical protein